MEHIKYREPSFDSICDFSFSHVQEFVREKKRGKQDVSF